MPNTNTEVIKLLTKAITLLGGGENAPEAFPDPDVIESMELDELKALAASVGVSTKLKQTELAKALVVLSKVGSKATDDVELAEAQLTCKSLGLEVSKKLTHCLENLEDYMSARTVEAPAEEETPEEATEGEIDEAAPTEAETGGEAEEEAPAEEEEPEVKPKKGKMAAVAAEEEPEAEAPTDEEGEASTEESEGEETSAEDEEEEEDSVKLKRLYAFNKVSAEKFDPKTLKKSYAKLQELLTDADGNVAEWGAPYIRGEGQEAEWYCCGMPTEETKLKNDKRQFGKCAVTGKLFLVDKKGNFVPFKTAA